MCAAIQVGCYFNGVVGAMLDFAYAIWGVFARYITLPYPRTLESSQKGVAQASESPSKVIVGGLWAYPLILTRHVPANSIF